jgi:hypothetical protein
MTVAISKMWRTILGVWVVAGLIGSEASAQTPQTGTENTHGAEQATAGQPAAAPDRPGRLVMAGWTYSSIVRNGVTANVSFSRGREVPNQDARVWRGVQLTGTVGRRGAELGLGYAWTAVAQIPLGYEFRALAGRRWTPSAELSPGRTYVGGEAAVMVTMWRFTGGLVVPIDPRRSHRPAMTGSIGIVMFLTGRLSGH